MFRNDGGKRVQDVTTSGGFGNLQKGHGIAFAEGKILATPERVYAAWIDGPEHSEFTGGEAIIDARDGGKHSAWSGYIEGRFVTLDPGKKLVMSWRTTEFDESDPDSLVEIAGGLAEGEPTQLRRVRFADHSGRR